MLQCQKCAGPLAGDVNAAAVDHGIGPGKIDELKHAQPLLGLTAVGGVGANAVFVGDHDLAGKNIPVKLRADGVQRTGFGGKHHAAVLQMSHAQRAEPVGVPDGDQLGGRGDHQ